MPRRITLRAVETVQAAGRLGDEHRGRAFGAVTMNWRGRPLESHEVIVQTIAAATTTTRTGLRVHAELDTNTYDTGVRISDRQHGALPVTRHHWHGDWNYTLRPEAYPHINADPDPFDQPSPDLAWLHHRALTGLAAPQWDALIATLMTLHPRQREASLDKRRGQPITGASDAPRIGLHAVVAARYQTGETRRSSGGSAAA